MVSDFVSVLAGVPVFVSFGMPSSSKLREGEGTRCYTKLFRNSDWSSVFCVGEACFAMRFGPRDGGGLGIARDVLTDMNLRLVAV